MGLFMPLNRHVCSFLSPIDDLQPATEKWKLVIKYTKRAVVHCFLGMCTSNKIDMTL